MPADRPPWTRPRQRTRGNGKIHESRHTTRAMALLAAAVLFLAAILIGLLSALLGIGGGSFMVPLLVLGGFVAETKLAVGTSIAAVAFTSLASSAGYLREGQVEIRLGLTLAPLTVVGGFLGAVASDVLPEAVLATAFGVFLVYPGARMVLDRELPERRVEDLDAHVLYPAVFLFGAVVGFASGLFGIGGGSLMVPALALGLGLSMTAAVATSLFAMFPSAVVASGQQWRQGNLLPEFAVPLILGITIGAAAGPRVAHRIDDDHLKRGFGLLLLALAARMVWRGLTV